MEENGKRTGKRRRNRSGKIRETSSVNSRGTSRGKYIEVKNVCGSGFRVTE